MFEWIVVESERMLKSVCKECERQACPSPSASRESLIQIPRSRHSAAMIVVAWSWHCHAPGFRLRQAHVIYLQRALAPDLAMRRRLVAAGHWNKAGGILRPRKTHVGLLVGDCSASLRCMFLYALRS